MAARHDQNPLALVKAREEKPLKPKTGLTPRIRKAVDFMVFGHPDNPGENVTVAKAADLVGMTARTIREALEKPAVKTYFRQCFSSLREAEKPASVRLAAEVRNDVNMKSTAAGRRVQLEAAKLLLTEPSGPQVNFNTQINNVSVTPGYVIDLTPEDDDERRHVERTSKTIDAEPAEPTVYTNRG
jgi:hypothetical protein